MLKQKTIIIYSSNIDEFGGVSTFLYNWCLGLRDYYDVTLLYGNSNQNQLRRLKKLVKTQKWNIDEQYECDIVLRNSVWGAVPINLTSRDERYLEMRHANYKYLIEQGLLYQQYTKWDKTNEVIGCGEFVSKMSNEVLHDNPTTIMNILAPRQKTNKIIKLISCTRLDSTKGWNRMLKMMDMMRGAGIKFQWDIFTPDRQDCQYEEVRFYKPRYDIWDYLANADYTVLLSDSEGLSYTVQESLQYQVPCIVSDVGGNTELIKDGINGYVVPLDMNFDIKKVLNIPKCPEYDNHALEKWLEYLGDSYYIEKEEIPEMKYLVEALDEYEKGQVTDIGLGYIPKSGERFVVGEDRLETLLGNNQHHTVFVKLIEKIEENEIVDNMIKETNAGTVKIKAVKKPSTKKTTNKK